MLAQFRRSAAIAALVTALGLGAAPVFAQSTSGIDTPTSSLPFSINGTAIMTLTSTGLTIGTGAVTYPTTPANGYLVGRGPTSDYRMDIQDGNGRVNQYWNAYTDGTVKYIVANEPAARLEMSANGAVTNGYFGFFGAPVSTAGAAITWTQMAEFSGATDVWLSPRGVNSDFYITSSGLVGIGTTAPAYQLDVSTGSVNAAAYYHSSDARLKTDIHPIHNALDKILALQGVRFNWKQDGRADMGVVAQNVAAVFPDVVSKNKDGMMSVEYDSLVGPMIESIRELKAENDALRQRVEKLEAAQARDASAETP